MDNSGWLTKQIVTTVKAIMERPCLTLSSARILAAFASRILACCCLSDSKPSSCVSSQNTLDG